MRRRYSIVVGALGAAWILSGCGQALALRGENQARAGIPTATPGAPVADQSAPAGVDAGASPDAGGIEPNIFNPPVSPAAPAESAPLPESSTAPDIVAEPSVPPVASVEPTVNPAFSNVGLPSAQERWRYVQVDRAVLPTVQTYRTTGTEILWWYDPVFGRAVKLGEIQGSFPVQATFRFRGQEAEALEVPYQVNQSFGITLPQATVEQMRNAGVGDWAETFIYLDSDISAQ